MREDDDPRRPVAVVLRALGLGDLLVAVPALRALRRGLPGHRILLAAPAWLEQVVDLIDAVDGLVPTPGLGTPIPVARPVDVAVNLHGGGPQSAAAVDALGARLTIRHAVPLGEEGGHARPETVPAWIEETHERVRWVRLVEAFGFPGDPDEVAIERPTVPSPAPGAAVLHVGAAHASRAWPPDRFATLARALTEAGHRVVLSGSAAERPRAQAVADAARLVPDAVLAGRTTLAELAALIAEASLLVSADTGAAHLASAFGTPSVVLFGPVPPERWGPPPGPHVALTHAALRVGDPFAPTPDPAIAAVTAEEVLAALEPFHR